ncbi:MAG: hypothetical protein IPJ12_13605 [Betaproteobacteria bacterium]|nr:hypothetical protein [Betaproteobacteria bacterium]
MTFLIAGIFLCIGSVLLFMGEFAAQYGRLPNWDDAHAAQNKQLYRQSLSVSVFGMILIVMGVMSLGLAQSFWHLSAKECVSMCILVFWSNCQARLIVFGLRNSLNPKTGENLISTLQKAFSIGWFPKEDGGVPVFIVATQVLALGFFLLGVWKSQ